MNQLENKNKEKVLNLIGLATRARLTSMGTDIVINSVQKNNAKIVFVASDASSETIKKIQDKCNYYKIICSTLFDTNELNNACGKNNIKVISINDKGFSESIKPLI